jgi:hypothetical protein
MPRSEPDLSCRRQGRLEKPLAPGTLVRPVGSQSELSIGEVVRTEPIHFDDRLYQLICYPSLGGYTVWSPVAMLEIVNSG